MLRICHLKKYIVWTSSNKIALFKHLYNLQWHHPDMKLYPRYFHHAHLCESLKFFSNERIIESKKDKSVILENYNRPLVLLFSWLSSKEQHIQKFVQFYLNLNMDVLRIRLMPMEVLRPVSGSQVTADNILDFLHANAKFTPILIHGFSAGCYLLGEVMVKIETNITLHRPLLKRFTGQIWDSGVDVDGVSSGLPKTLTNSIILQKLIQNGLEYYLNVASKRTSVHYYKSSEKFHENYLNLPALVFFSEADVMSTVNTNMVIIEKWKRRGTTVFWKCFTQSGHIQHFLDYRSEYVEEVMSFLEWIRILDYSKPVTDS